MAYLGNSPVLSQQEYRNIDNISGSFNGVTTSFALLVNGVAPVPAPQSSNQCLISVNGVVQKPDDTGATGFRLSGGNIIFSSAPTGGQSFFGVILAGADYIYAGQNFPDGTVSAPSITFAQDTDTGFFRSGAGEIKYTANGTAVVTLSSNNLTAPSFIPTSSSAPTNGVYLPAANSVGISTNSTERLRITSAGLVGIGTSTVDELLHLKGASAASTTLKVESTATASERSSIHFFNGSVSRGRVGGSNDFDGLTLDSSTTESAAAIRFRTGGTSLTTKMTLTSGGSLGIGTTAPNCPFVVAGGSGLVSNFTNQSDADFNINCTSGVTTIGPQTGVLALKSSNTERARIDSSGRLLVGTTSAQGQSIFQAVGNSSASTDPGDIRVIRGLAVSGIGSNVGAELGIIKFGALENSVCAEISAVCDDTWSSTSDTPGRLAFKTTPNSNSAPVERLRIGNNGQLFSVIPGGSTVYPGFMARAWISMNGTGAIAIKASGGITSISDAGTGTYDINFSFTMADVNYAVVTGFQRIGTADEFVNVGFSNNTGTFRVEFFSGGVTADTSTLQLAIFR